MSQRTRTLLAWLGAYAGLAAVVGFLSGIFWSQVVVLPTFTVQENFVAVTTERGLTEVFGVDAWFVGVGLLVGIGLGIIAWRWFSDLGWPVTFVAVGGAAIAALITWGTGVTLGPGPFDERLAQAMPGDVVPVQFELHSLVTLVVWAFAAVAPIVVRSSLGPDPEDVRPRRKPAPVQQPTAEGEVVGHDIAPPRIDGNRMRLPASPNAESQDR